MSPGEMLELALFLGGIVIPATTGLTGFFKSNWPKANAKLFSMIVGAILSVVAWFATTPIPQTVAMWSALVLVCFLTSLMPSGMFDALVNVRRKALVDSYEPLERIEHPGVTNVINTNDVK